MELKSEENGVVLLEPDVLGLEIVGQAGDVGADLSALRCSFLTVVCQMSFGAMVVVEWLHV